MIVNTENSYHTSVLLKEAVEALQVIPNAWYVDATVGFGGHTQAILNQQGKVIGLDQDEVALKHARELLESHFLQESWRFIHANFRTVKAVLDQEQILPQGVLFDLGVSSYQLDGHERGFSFQEDELLDMRMDPSTQTITAKDLVNDSHELELAKMISIYGEDRLAKQIARAIVAERASHPVTTTKQLAQIVAHLYRSTYRDRSQKHPATKTFQALRIAVNDEMNSLKAGLQGAIEGLAPDGICAVITFHSLEDRIVKHTFKHWQYQGLGVVITKKPIIPTKEEIAANPRSRSAKLRVFKKKYD